MPTEEDLNRTRPDLSNSNNSCSNLKMASHDHHENEVLQAFMKTDSGLFCCGPRNYYGPDKDRHIFAFGMEKENLNLSSEQY